MIDATKLVVMQDYYVKYYKVWLTAYWSERGVFVCVGNREYSPSELTAAIPIPSPEQLAAMWGVIERVPFSNVDLDLIETARKLLEKRT